MADPRGLWGESGVQEFRQLHDSSDHGVEPLPSTACPEPRRVVCLGAWYFDQTRVVMDRLLSQFWDEALGEASSPACTMKGPFIG